MLLGARMFFESRRGNPPLPYDYAVEYIETDGVASFIDTGITPTYESVVHATVQSISVPFPTNSSLASNPLFGAASSSAAFTMNFALIAQTGKGVFKPAQPNILSSSSPPAYDNNIHDVIIGSGVFDFDGISLGANAISTSRTIGVFCLGSRGAIPVTPNPQYGYTDTRFYSCKIYTNNVLVFDGIPVVANGLAGLYDSISGTVKTNAAATGTITAGPRV